MLTKTEPKISVIIPVYNVEKYLKKCLDSLINQTFKDVEIICIDDGSTDNCLNILNDYAAQDDRIIVLHQENQGPGAARNNGLRIAKGEYISFVDPDDCVNIDFYKTLYKEAKESDSDIVKGVRADVYPDSVKTEKLKLIKDMEFAPVFSSWWSCIYKSKIIKDNNLLFPAAYSFEDMAFLMLFITFAKTCSISKDAIYYHVHRTDSLTPQGKSLARSIEGFESKMYAFRLIQNDNISKPDYLKSMKYFMGSFMSSIDLFITNGHYENFDSINGYINEILSTIKYKKELLKDKKYKFLAKGDFSKENFDKLYAKKKFKTLGFLKKLFYIGNARGYKMLSILGFLITIKRSRA